MATVYCSASMNLMNEKFLDVMFIGTTLLAVGHQIFMRGMDSECFEAPEWNEAAEAGE